MHYLALKIKCEYRKTILETQSYFYAQHVNKLNLAAALYPPEGSALCREDERERRDKVGYLIRRFSQLGKG